MNAQAHGLTPRTQVSWDKRRAPTEPAGPTRSGGATTSGGRWYWQDRSETKNLGFGTDRVGRRDFEPFDSHLLSHKKRTVSTIRFFLFPEHETGFEPATLALARRYSTTEPLVHFL